MRVKICGLRAAEHVVAAVEAGADAIGFVLVDSPRRVTPGEAARLGACVPSHVARVAVVRKLSEAAIADALAAGCTHLQAIGSAEAFATLPADLAPVPVVLEGADADAQLEALASLRAPVLFDGARQGSGRRSDLALAAQLAARHPIVLAGGLDPDGVAEVIARVRPLGVDVSSGVERAPGEKSAVLIQSFVRAARAALDRLAHGAPTRSPSSSVSPSIVSEESSCR